MNFKLWKNTEPLNFCILGCCRLAAEAKVTNIHAQGGLKNYLVIKT